MNKQTRRTVILTTVILGFAVLGLIATNSFQSGKDRTAAESLGQVMQDATPNQATSGDPGSPLWAIVKLLSALAIVIAALYGGLYLLKRMMMTRRTASARQAALEVIESAYVGPKKTVSLVRVGNKAVLVGVTDQQISMLTELSPAETADLLTQTPETKTAETFAHMFKRTTDKFREMQTGKAQPIVGA
jgi:flagellar protein FliO/FliZ